MPISLRRGAFLRFPRARSRVALLGLVAAGVLLGLAGAAAATPTMQQTIDYARLEIGAHCRDADRSAFSQIDQHAVGAVRTCDVDVTPRSLQLSVRQRAATTGADIPGAPATRPYAELDLSVAFDRKSSFLCGPSDRPGQATLFVACNMDLGLNGPQCAERQIAIPRSGMFDYEARYRMSAAEILSLDANSCQLVARALSYIGARAARRPSPDDLASRAFE